MFTEFVLTTTLCLVMAVVMAFFLLEIKLLQNNRQRPQ